MQKYLTAFFALALSAGAAQAADEVYFSDPAPYDWSGLYVGAQVGVANTSLGFGLDDTDVIGGAHAGYLMQNGRFVYGVEVEGNLTGLSPLFVDVDAFVAAKAKAGVAFDRILVTGSVGYGHAWASLGPLSLDDGGLVVGAGVDYAYNDRIIVGADYLYSNIQNFDFTPLDVDSHAVRARISVKFP